MAGDPTLPYPTSLCHRCAAPPRFIRTASSVFILCPILPDKYPRQPVASCALFRPAAPPLPPSTIDPTPEDE